ncbi:flagellar biosynthesis anti-sigma factor FlgM [Sphingomonas sp. PB4P5]|uniref:flagellar biosynthesis anti-sigma factor FlgM n=1 Tax=Parasphingomonas puruogangriensis TaxID=3096155 RepID=UPI002FC887CE
MVDPIGLKPVPTSTTVAAVTRIAATAAPDSVTVQEQLANTPVTLSRTLAATPPIDHERVAQIRQAIAEGSFPITPAQIADRLIAAKLEWTRNDPR